MATQLWPEDKFQFSPFSYAKAIIKDDITYPIVPNCPIINTDESGSFDCQNIPVGTLFIVHRVDGSSRDDSLCLRVPDDTTGAAVSWGLGYIRITSRWKNSYN